MARGMMEEDAKELAESIEQANADSKRNAPYLRAKRALAALHALPEDARSAVQARTLGVALAAVADALDDSDPDFERQRGRLLEVVARAVPTAIGSLRNKRDALESDHVMALLAEANENYVNARDGWCNAEASVDAAVAWLDAHDYARAAEHLRQERSLAVDAVRAADKSAWNKAMHSLLNARGFAPIELDALKKRKSKAARARLKV